MKKFIIFFSAIMAALTIRSEASEITIGAAPDPYEAIWQQATEEDIQLIAQIVWYESAIADCPDEVNRAVIETILNRVLSPNFPNTIKGVCTQRGAFYRRNSTITNETVMNAIQFARQNGRTVLPSYSYCYFATKKQSLGKDHIWVGNVKANGKPRKGKGMYFCRGKL